MGISLKINKLKFEKNMSEISLEISKISPETSNVKSEGSLVFSGNLSDHTRLHGGHRTVPLVTFCWFWICFLFFENQEEIFFPISRRLFMGCVQTGSLMLDLPEIYFSNRKYTD